MKLSKELMMERDDGRRCFGCDSPARAMWKVTTQHGQFNMCAACAHRRDFLMAEFSTQHRTGSRELSIEQKRVIAYNRLLEMDRQYRCLELRGRLSERNHMQHMRIGRALRRLDAKLNVGA